MGRPAFLCERGSAFRLSEAWRELDPFAVVAALATVVTTLSGILYRALLQRAERAEADALFWRNQALRGTRITEVAVDVAAGEPISKHG